MPYICLVAKGTLPKLNVSETITIRLTARREGLYSCCRSAKGHIAALEAMTGKSDTSIYSNLGTGTDFRATACKTPLKKGKRDKNTLPNLRAPPRRYRLLVCRRLKGAPRPRLEGRRDIYDMVKSSWNFYSQSAEK